MQVNPVGDRRHRKLPDPKVDITAPVVSGLESIVALLESLVGREEIRRTTPELRVPLSEVLHCLGIGHPG